MIEFVSAAVKAAKPLNKGVPGVPLHALDAIPDENTRLVLRSIVDGWHVRNGSSGSGDVRFITARELATVTGKVDGLSDQLTKTNALAASFAALTPGKINELISDLHSQVFESLLFKRLEERVDLVDKPGGIFDRLGEAETTLVNEISARVSGDQGLAQSLQTLGLRVGNAETILTNEITQRISGDTALTNSLSALATRVGTAEAGLITETNQRVNADNAIQSSVTTQFSSVNKSLSLVQSKTDTTANNVSALTTRVDQIQASVNGAYAAISTEQTARVNADNTLYAQYTLRVDVNGRVSGFGLAASPSVSDFIVRADRFSIVSPDGSNRAALIMTNNTINVFDENGNLRVKIGRLA